MLVELSQNVTSRTAGHLFGVHSTKAVRWGRDRRAVTNRTAGLLSGQNFIRWGARRRELVQPSVAQQVLLGMLSGYDGPLSLSNDTPGLAHRLV